MSLCSVPGCGKVHRAKGMCSTHWQRAAGYVQKSFGEPICADPAQKWLREVALKYEDDACLDWPFRVGTHGYGEVRHQGRTSTAPRVVCILTYGKPLFGYEVLHSCNRRLCVNKRHLRWGTRKENVADCIAAGNFSYPHGRNL